MGFGRACDFSLPGAFPRERVEMDELVASEGRKVAAGRKTSSRRQFSNVT